MRVTTSTYSDTLATHLQRITQRQVSLQTQISSGQRVQELSDDPVGASQVLKLRENSASASQFQKNIQSNREFADVSFATMRSLQKVLDRAQEIAFSVDDLDSTGDLRSYSVEVDQLIKQALQTANSMHRGEYLLSGTNTGTKAFEAVLDGEGRIAGVTFAGNSEVSESEIAQGVLVSSRVPGANESGSGERGLLSDSRYGADFFGHLIALRDSLAAGDAQAVASTRPLLQQDEENIIHHVANNASLQSRLEATLSSTKDEKLALESEISRRADIDLAETIVRLNQTQTNYQAALQSAGSVLNLTLLDFLR